MKLHRARLAPFHMIAPQIFAERGYSYVLSVLGQVPPDTPYKPWCPDPSSSCLHWRKWSLVINTLPKMWLLKPPRECWWLLRLLDCSALPQSMWPKMVLAFFDCYMTMVKSFLPWERIPPSIQGKQGHLPGVALLCGSQKWTGTWRALESHQEERLGLMLLFLILGSLLQPLFLHLIYRCYYCTLIKVCFHFVAFSCHSGL